MSERSEALWRILVGFVALLILGVWNYVIQLIWIVHWIIVLFTNKRIKDLSEFNNHYATYSYKINRYIGFSTNVRPWPFEDFAKPMEKCDMKKPKK